MEKTIKTQLKEGDFLEAKSGKFLEADWFKLEVLGVCGKIVFTQKVFKGGMIGPPEMNSSEDLYTWGFSLTPLS